MTTSLALPNPRDFSAFDRADLADSTRIKYRRAWERAIAAGVDLTDPDAVLDYALTLPASGKLHLSAAMKIQTEDMELRLKSNLDPRQATPENVAILTALFWKLEALRKSVPTKAEKGKKAHTWLTQQQVDDITAIAAPDTSQRGMRDYIVLATLLGAGLRREEMHDLTFDSLKRIPWGDDIRDVLQVTGKGGATRVVLISPVLAKRLRGWKQHIGDGRVARSINKADKVGGSLSEDGIFDIVREYGALIDLPDLDPHDCRRSYGRLVYEASGRDIMFVRDQLGHRDVKTTMRYIGVDLNLEIDVTDFVIREPIPGLRRLTCQ